MIVLTPRLYSVASFVSGERLIDVGTDHAYLPVYLLNSGKIKYAWATDINKGPLKKAGDTISQNGCSDNCKTILTDGLNGLDELDCSDISIAGMGGILITEIIEKSELAKKSNLILQPMTHPHLLRKYLYDHGYSIIDEDLAKEDRRIYQIIIAKYTGISEKYSEYELYLGKKNIENKKPELFKLFCEKVHKELDIKFKGTKDPNLGEILKEIERIISQL